MSAEIELKKYLQGLKEDQLTEEIIIPLLWSMGFEKVEKRHGANERGVDILCIREDALNEVEVTVIQVKKTKLTANTKSKSHPIQILNQLVLAAQSKFELADKTKRVPHNVWFMTPFDMPPDALRDTFDSLEKLDQYKIKIVDGTKIAELVRIHKPELLAQFDKGIARYQNILREEVGRLQEASALKLNEKIQLLPIHVQMHMSMIQNSLGSFRNSQELAQSEMKHAFAVDFRKDKIYRSYGKMLKSLIGSNPIRVTKPTKSKIEKWNKQLAQSKKDMSDKFPRSRVVVDSFSLLNGLERRIYDAIPELENVTESCPALDAISLAKINRLNQDLHVLVETPGAKNILEMAVENRAAKGLNKSAKRLNRSEIDVDTIIDSRVNLHLVADAGSGKTTLLRMLIYRELEKSSDQRRLSIYAPLSRMNMGEQLLDFLARVCQEIETSILPEYVTDQLAKGNALIALDGIDEAVQKKSDIGESILGLIAKYPGAQFVFSARPWAKLKPSKHYITANLCHFSNSQVELFFRRWFVESPDKALAINEHVKCNPRLFEIISTPLFCTMFAIIAQFGRPLPTSKTQLMEERLRLFLSDWDHVKYVERDKFSPEDKRHFLKKMAYFLHERKKRELEWGNMVDLVIRFIGRINDLREAGEFLKELVHNNNMIFKNSEDCWGLGHLQYQEYLAALEARDNKKVDLSIYLSNPFWYWVLEMYAELTGDVGAIIENAQSMDKIRENYTTIKKLLVLAPNTDPDCLDGLYKIGTSSISQLDKSDIRNDQMYYSPLSEDDISLKDMLVE